MWRTNAPMGYSRPMIGKSLRERMSFGPLSVSDTERLCKEVVASHARALVETRAKSPRMVVCAVVRAEGLTLRVCKNLGFDLKRGATAVFGVRGEDVPAAFPELGPPRHEWLAVPSRDRETKLLVLSGGFALVGLRIEDGVVVFEHPAFA